jgi:hypothetical protein
MIFMDAGLVVPQAHHIGIHADVSLSAPAAAPQKRREVKVISGQKHQGSH